MLSTKEISLVFETLLSGPGMSDAVKCSGVISRKNILLLANLVDLGSKAASKEGSGIPGLSDEKSLHEVNQFVGALIEKAGLTVTCEKITAILVKQ